MKTPRQVSLAIVLCGALLSAGAALPEAAAPDLRVGAAFHAFDHLGNYGRQAEAAAASGVTLIYATGVGGDGYLGLPPAAEWEARRKDCAEYVRQAKSLGIKTVLGYLCATSIVGLDTFAKHWTDEQRAEFRSAPETWLQQDIDGKPLESWYGGAYKPACMNHPDWRAYERYMVRAQLQSGHDGIFFDNPTVHPKGCYCPHCMAGFSAFLRNEGVGVNDESTEALRKLAAARPSDFKRYRCTIARNFIQDMRTCARNLNPNALLTANNSLNSPGAFYSQCDVYAYNIHEMSKTEDFVVVEDMATQPRALPDGKLLEYGPTYRQLHAIIHDKPLVAVTIAEGDYHTPPNLVRLAMIEGVAHGASYMLWSTWPEDVRPKMAAAVRPCADWLRSHADLLQALKPRQDVLVFLPFRRWLDTEDCAVSDLAAQLTRANIAYGVFCEDDFASALQGRPRALLLEKREVLLPAEQEAVAAYEASGGRVLTADSRKWLNALRKAAGAPSLLIDGPKAVRGVVADAPGKTAVWLYNLNVQRLSSFEDRVIPAEALKLTVRVPFHELTSAVLSACGPEKASQPLEFSTNAKDGALFVHLEIPKLPVGALVLLSGKD